MYTTFVWYKVRSIGHPVRIEFANNGGLSQLANHRNAPVFQSYGIAALLFIYCSGVMANMLDYNIEESEFEFQSCYCVHFRTNILGKGKESPIPLSPISYGLSSTTTVLLQEWIWLK